jgi:prepilin peptidase CpaA
MNWPPPTAHVAVVVIALVALVTDLRSRKVPNVLTFGAAGAACLFQFVTGGWQGLLWACAGWTVGFVMFLPFFALGGMGAGDVKLLGAFGAWLGPLGALWTALFGALAGGVLALVVSLAQNYTGTAFRNLGMLLRSWFLGGVRPVEGVTLSSSAGPRLPYAVPLAVGAVMAAWLR